VVVKGEGTVDRSGEGKIFRLNFREEVRVGGEGT